MHRSMMQNQGESESFRIQNTTNEHEALTGGHNAYTKETTSIPEAGVISFFIRGRVDTHAVRGPDDIARTFILLRPIAQAGQPVRGTLKNADATRVIILPKKVLPSRRERFMAFIEKANASDEEISAQFHTSSSYETKTAGTRHMPAARQVGKGTYVFLTTGSESRLIYTRTVPEEAGNVQRDLGLQDRGSFVICTKNPSHEGPPNAQMSARPNFPKGIVEEFRNLRWLPSKPVHFDYSNTQLLLIGEDSESGRGTEYQGKNILMEEYD